MPSLHLISVVFDTAIILTLRVYTDSHVPYVLQQHISFNMQVLFLAAVPILAKVVVLYILIGYPVRELNQILLAAHIQLHMEPIT